MFTYLVVGFTIEITNVLLFVANHESSKGEIPKRVFT